VIARQAAHADRSMRAITDRPYGAVFLLASLMSINQFIASSNVNAL
jgi:hypothetical protein